MFDEYNSIELSSKSGINYGVIIGDRKYSDDGGTIIKSGNEIQIKGAIDANLDIMKSMGFHFNFEWDEFLDCAITLYQRGNEEVPGFIKI